MPGKGPRIILETAGMCSSKMFDTPTTPGYTIAECR